MSKSISELKFLENYRLLFVNYAEIAELKTELEEFTYDEAKMNQGKVLYEKAQELFDKNQQNTSVEKKAYAVFNTSFEKLYSLYAKHRKIAKVALNEHPQDWVVLGLDKNISQSYLPAINGAKTLYQGMKSNPDTLALLEKMKLTEAIATEQLALIEETEKFRAKYEQEKGKSQQATLDKKNAIDELHKWGKQFYAVAKIALEDKPQLLESIGKFVKN